MPEARLHLCPISVVDLKLWADFQSDCLEFGKADGRKVGGLRMPAVEEVVSHMKRYNSLWILLKSAPFLHGSVELSVAEGECLHGGGEDAEPAWRRGFQIFRKITSQDAQISPLDWRAR